MNLDDDQLTAFALVIQEGSFEQAAKRLHITPSAVSQRVKLLEDNIGQIIIQRKRPCIPTEYGKTLLALASKIELLKSEAMGALRDSNKAGYAAKRLVIAVNADSMACWFVSVFDDMVRWPDINLSIITEDQSHTAELLRSGAVMAAVTDSPSIVQGCDATFLGVMRYAAVMSSAYANRYFRDGVNKDNLSLAPSLAFNNKDDLQRLFIRKITSLELDPIVHYIPSSNGLLEAAKRGLGWVALPELLVRDAVQRGDLVQLTGDVYLDIKLYWQYWRIGSSSLKLVSDMVIKASKAALRQNG